MNKYSFKKVKNFILELFFPCFCYGCQKEGTYLCEDCKAVLEILQTQYCVCGKEKCEKCSSKKLSGLYFALPYKNTLTKKLIRQFKYEPYVKDLAKTLSGLLLEHFVISGKNTNDIWQNSILVPIPLDKNKMKSRGYNQSEELAKELSKFINIPVICDSLIKIRQTKSQAELSKAERIENVKNAFTIKNPEQVSGKKVFLVDDVYTTGCTMEECANLLKLAKAESVFGITIAREQ